MDSCAKARSRMPTRGTGARATKPGHVGRRCLNNCPEIAVLRSASLVVVALLTLGGVPAAEEREITSHISRQSVHSDALAAVGYCTRLYAPEVVFVSGAVRPYRNGLPQL